MAKLEGSALGRGAVLAAALVAAGCRQAPSAGKQAGGFAPPRVQVAEPSRKRTTDGAIAVRNLDSQIAGYEHLVGRKINVVMAAGALVPLYVERGEYLGRLRDYDRAEELANRRLALAADGEGYLDRAMVRSTFHQFADALADLDEAARRHAKPAAVEGLRASVLQAMGRTKEALALRSARRSSDIAALGNLASLEAELGKEPSADALYSQALASYRDVSPFPVAWIDFQRGVMWERAGQLGKAKASYEDAVARLPQYAHAQAHLAGIEAATGDRTAAIARLQKVVAATLAPEFEGQLGSLLVQVGRRAEGRRLLDEAAAGYADLLERHRVAWADHAAHFWLDAAQEHPEKADELAQVNLQARQSRDAYELSLDAALAANDTQVACRVADDAMASLGDVPKLRYLARRAYAACGELDKAAALERPLASAP